jgi:hypothetical protein
MERLDAQELSGGSACLPAGFQNFLLNRACRFPADDLKHGVKLPPDQARRDV